jgi:hypothetical protein
MTDKENKNKKNYIQINSDKNETIFIKSDEKKMY